jgi:phage-related protein
MATGSRTLKLSILGDVDNLNKSLKAANADVENSSSKLGDFSKKAGLAFAAAGAAAALYAGKLLIDGVKSAIADEAAQASLAKTLGNVTGATNDQIAAVEDQIKKNQLLFGVSDQQLRPSLERLLRATKDVSEAQKLQSLALDIAAGSGKSLEAVSNALGKAYEGNSGALAKLGVGLSAAQLKTMSMDDVTQALATTFGGQATAKADTFQGKMLRLSETFNEAKETVGGYVLNALTPLLDGFVNKGIPAITAFSDSLGKTLGPAFATIFKVIRDDLLPVLTKWWSFLVDEIIPAITSIVKPILEGLSSAFNTIKKAVAANSEELQPFYDFLYAIWKFIKNDLAPLLGGAFKIALQTIGTIVGGLVTGFSKLVGFISSTISKMKEFVNYIKDNPVTRFFGGGDNSKSLTVSGSGSEGLVVSGGGGFDTGTGTGTGTGTTGIISSATGVDIGVYSAAMQAAIIRRDELKAETARLNEARAAAAAARLAQTGGLSTATVVNQYFNAVVADTEAAARAVTDVLNNSTNRGTNGAANLVYL